VTSARQKAIEREIDEQSQRVEVRRHGLQVCIEGQKPQKNQGSDAREPVGVPS
jgi:hypothetical protein